MRINDLRLTACVACVAVEKRPSHLMAEVIAGCQERPIRTHVA